MRNIAIKQAVFIPLGAMLVLIVVGVTVPGYSSIAQQGSELGLLEGYPAVLESVLAMIVGVSIIAFSLALIRHPSGPFAFTALTSALFGVSMLFNGLFPMGGPLHGLYGIGFFTVLSPVLFIAEMKPAQRTGAISLVSRWAAVLTLFYLWLTVVGLDPRGYQGLTQRLAVIPMFGWYSYASYMLSQNGGATGGRAAVEPSGISGRSSRLNPAVRTHG